MDAVALVEDEVRELVRRRDLDPVLDVEGVRALVREVIAEYDERSLTDPLPPLVDVDAAARAVVDAVAGLGPLQRYLDDPSVEEVWTNEPLTPRLLRWARLIFESRDSLCMHVTLSAGLSIRSM